MNVPLAEAWCVNNLIYSNLIWHFFNVPLAEGSIHIVLRTVYNTSGLSYTETVHQDTQHSGLSMPASSQTSPWSDCPLSYISLRTPRILCFQDSSVYHHCSIPPEKHQFENKIWDFTQSLFIQWIFCKLFMHDLHKKLQGFLVSLVAQIMSPFNL